MKYDYLAVYLSSQKEKNPVIWTLIQIQGMKWISLLYPSVGCSTESGDVESVSFSRFQL